MAKTDLVKDVWWDDEVNPKPGFSQLYRGVFVKRHKSIGVVVGFNNADLTAFLAVVDDTGVYESATGAGRKRLNEEFGYTQWRYWLALWRKTILSDPGATLATLHNKYGLM